MNKAFTESMSYGRFLRYLGPSILSMIFVSFYTTVDGFFVSRWVGSDALAAINIIIPVTCVSFGIAVMLATGSGALVGIKMGEGKRQEAEGFFSYVSIMLAVIAVVLTVLGLVFLEDILILCGSTDRLMPYTRSYGFWTVVMTPAIMGKLYLEYYARIDGSPKVAMVMSVTGLVLNIVLDYLLIVRFDMGIAGAGIGTGLAILLSGLVGVWYFVSGKSRLKWRRPTGTIKNFLFCCFNGSSEMLTELSTGITTLLFNLALLQYGGENGVAAMSIVTYLFYFFVAVYFGIAVGAQPIISYNYGAKDTGRIREVLKQCLVTTVVSSILVFFISFVFARQIIGIFTTDPEVVQIAFYGLRLFSFGFLLSGVNIFLSGHFTAIGAGGISAVISISRSLVFVILFLPLLSNMIGLRGVWLTTPAAELATGFIAIGLLLTQQWRWSERKTNLKKTADLGKYAD